MGRNISPLRLPDPCPLAHTRVVVCKVSGPPVLCYGLSLALGPTVLGHTYIPRLQSEGPVVTRFATAFMYSLSSAILQNCRHHETQNLSHPSPLTHCSKLYELLWPSPVAPAAKPLRHKQRPATHHHGRGPSNCIFLLALNRHTHQARGLPFARVPFGFTPLVEVVEFGATSLC